MSLGHKTLTGVLWQGLQVLANRAANLICWLVLATLLLPEDRGIVMKAVSVLTVAGVVADFGAGRLLVRRKKRFHQWVGPAAAFTFGSSLLTMAAMMATAPLLAVYFFHSPAVSWMIVVLALDLPLRALMVPSRVGLQADMRFREISRIQIIQGVFMVVVSIALAVWLPAGQKGWSMVWSVPVTSLLGLVLFWRVKPIAFWRKLRLDRIRHLIRDSAGMAAYSILVSFVYVGDNLMLGHFQKNEVPLGHYSNAYMLAVQMVNLVANSLSMVLFPALASVKDDKPQLRAAWMKAMKLLGFVAFPACLIQIPLADPGVRLLMNEAWYPAIPMMQVLSLGVAVRAAGVLVEPLMFAAGRMRLVIAIGVMQSLCVVVASAIAANVWPENQAMAVAVGVAIAYAVMYTVAIALCAHEVGLPWWRPLAVLAKPFLCACVAVGAAWALAFVPWPVLRVAWHGGGRDLGLLLEAAAMALLAIGLYSTIALAFMREEMNDLLRRVKGVKIGPPAPVAAD